MAARRPLVRVDGQLKELPAGDTVDGAVAGSGLTEPQVRVRVFLRC